MLLKSELKLTPRGEQICVYLFPFSGGRFSALRGSFRINRACGSIYRSNPIDSDIFYDSTSRFLCSTRHKQIHTCNLQLIFIEYIGIIDGIYAVSDVFCSETLFFFAVGSWSNTSCSLRPDLIGKTMDFRNADSDLAKSRE